MAEHRKIVNESVKHPAGGGRGYSLDAGFESLNWFNRAWVEWAGAMGVEFTRFVSDRIREDMRTQHAILNCGEPGKLQEIQKDFFDKAVADYTAETGRLADIGNAFVNRIRTPDRVN